ncbi:baseplate assembly protein [Hathewaya massiliensis]|uniref:baseplate assembly protein n=1 Tax=Hathewaya massiliensis TaxID=1964382 RepID=UPI001FAB2B9D|nr:baseplate J/gp47 family protein [Hathewaya massiliensis]
MEINFIETAAENIYMDVISSFEKTYGETLYPGDERRIFLQQIVPIIVACKNNINDSAKQNLLRYARDEILDCIGEDFFSTKRLQATRATCKGKIKLIEGQNKDIIVPEGTRITPDGTIFFRVTKNIIISVNKGEAECILEAVDIGEEYNNFLPGQIKNIVDPIAFVESIVNITTSEGGSDIETNERYRERCRLAPESYSTAGPSGAYEYFAKTANSNIVDVKIISPSPGVINIIPLLKNGEIPGKEVLDNVLDVCSKKDRRPLTDKVEVKAPEIVKYDINIEYYLDMQHETEELKFRKLIEGEKLDCSEGAIRDFINWQQEQLGKRINPDELRFRIQNAVAYKIGDGKVCTAIRRIVVNTPNFRELKETEVAKVGDITVKYGGLE